MQKRAIRTMMGCGYRVLQKVVCRTENTATCITIYIYSLLLFVVKNRNYFTSNSVIYDSNTRHRNDLHVPQATLAMYQKGVYCSEVNVFSSLPRALKEISSEPGKFKTALRKFLEKYSFYSLDEFFAKQ